MNGAAEHYDVVIVGGGIHGVGVAQAAAAAGHRTLLLEQRSLAAGTSSRSSKLIHGGLRYLETAQLGVVRECLRERSLLLRLAPALVQLREFHIPVYATTTRRPWQLRLGLGLYAVLAGMRRGSGFGTVPREQWEALDGLRLDGMQAVFRYRDAQTDDAALTRAVMRSARELGAELAMPARFSGASIDAAGCTIQYTRGAAICSCRASVLVNAAGPWAPRVLESIEPAPAIRPIDLVAGAHVLLQGRTRRGIYYIESPDDRRAVFVMPAGEHTLVGTTETPYHGDPAHVQPTDEERAYLLRAFTHFFPQRDTTVLDAYAGLRVLPAREGPATGRSRETMLEVDDPRRPRLITILGGKLTSYRATAERVMERLRPSLPDRRGIATSTIELSPPD